MTLEDYAFIHRLIVINARLCSLLFISYNISRKFGTGCLSTLLKALAIINRHFSSDP